MSVVKLSRLVEVNPATPEIEHVGDDEHITFTPLEAVWADSRADFSRRRLKSQVNVGYTRFKDGDVLVPKVTPTFQAGRATVARVPTFVGAGSTELHVLRPRRDVDARFISYVCRSAPFLAEGVASFQGVAGLQRVPDDFVRQFPVAVSALDEQRRISDFLDRRISHLEAVKVRRLRQVELISEWYTRTLDDLFRSGSEGFQEVRFGRLLRTPPCYGVLVPKFASEGVPLIRVSDLGSLTDNLQTLPKIEFAQAAEYKRTKLNPGDVLLTVVGATIGRHDVVPEAAAGLNISRAISRLQVIQSVPSDIVRAWFDSSSFKSQAALTTSVAAAQPALNMGDLVSFKINLPTSDSAVGDLCKRVVEVKAIRDESICLLKVYSEKLSELQLALITAAVTGKIDVTTARGVSA